MDSSRLSIPGTTERINALLDQGVDLLSYEVSATKLRDVIQDSPASNELKRNLISYLDDRVIKNQPTVKCILLGMAISQFAEMTDDEDLVAIHRNVVDLNKLPYVTANGKSVS